MPELESSMRYWACSGQKRLREEKANSSSWGLIDPSSGSTSNILSSG